MIAEAAELMKVALTPTLSHAVGEGEAEDAGADRVDHRSGKVLLELLFRRSAGRSVKSKISGDGAPELQHLNSQRKWKGVIAEAAELMKVALTPTLSHAVGEGGEDALGGRVRMVKRPRPR